MNPPPDSGNPQSLETIVAVMAERLRTLEIDVKGLKDKEHLDKAGARELCREVLREEVTSNVGSKDSVMRIIAFAVSIGTAIFVIRGGR